MRIISIPVLSALGALALASPILAQGFGRQQNITTSADRATAVHAVDLDGDGDADVLSASTNDDKIAWYENEGGGVFGGRAGDHV